MNKEMIMNFVEFTGEETEKEFLEKCYKQWEIACEAKTDIQKLIIIGSIFHEIEHRIREIE